MDSIAVTAEFNPFHTGHAYLLRTLRQRAGDQKAIVVIMSGSFVQRGEPALFDKRLRAFWALQGGADCVIELPAACVLNSAPYFAAAAVRLAAALGCQAIACGTETLSAAAITAAVNRDDAVSAPGCDRKNATYGTRLTEKLYRQNPDFATALTLPNNLLAWEYAKASRTYAPTLSLLTVPRCGRHTAALQDGDFVGATALRKAIGNGIATAEYSRYIPPAVLPSLCDAVKNGTYTDYARYHDAVLYESRRRSLAELKSLTAFAEGLENRWKTAMNRTADWQTALAAIKTKRYSYSRLCRMSAYIVLGLHQETMNAFLRTGPQYARILGAGERGRRFLKEAKAIAGLPLLTDLSKRVALTETAREQLTYDLLAADMQHFFFCRKDARQGGSEYVEKPILV